MSVTEVVFRNQRGETVRRMPSSLLDPFFKEKGVILERNDHPQSVRSFFVFEKQVGGVMYFEEAPFREGMLVVSP